MLESVFWDFIFVDLYRSNNLVYVLCSYMNCIILFLFILSCFFPFFFFIYILLTIYFEVDFLEMYSIYDEFLMC